MVNIPNPIMVNFDPLASSTPFEVKKIFGNNIARTIWMSYKANHSPPPNLNAKVINITKIIDENGLPNNSTGLLKIMHLYLENIKLEFTDELFQYITGEKTLEYKIV